MWQVWVLTIVLSCSLAGYAQGTRDTVSTAPENSNTLGISLAAAGLGLSLAGAASPIVGLVGQLNDDAGKRVYGHGVGPALTISGGILSWIAIKQLNARQNPHGSYGELQNTYDRVSFYASIGSAAVAVSVLGAILFYSGIQTNQITLSLTFPVAFLGEVLNMIAEVKSLRTNLRYSRGTPPPAG